MQRFGQNQRRDAALALEKEKAEKYALVQEALLDAVEHTILIPSSGGAHGQGADSEAAAVEVLQQHWRTLQQAATVVGSLAWDLKPFCAAPPVWQSEITIALRVSIRRLGGATNDTQAKLQQRSKAAGVSLVGSSPRDDDDDGALAASSGVSARDLCGHSQACVRITHRELGRIFNLLKELHRLLLLLARGLPCPGLDGRVKIVKPEDVAVVPLELEGKAQSHRERVTDMVPTTIPLEYTGHYTVLGKVDVTAGLEPNTKIVGYFFFGTLEVIGSAQSVLCPQLKRLQTSKGWVTWRPTLIEKLEANSSWAVDVKHIAGSSKDGAGGDGDGMAAGGDSADSIDLAMEELGLTDGTPPSTADAEAALLAEFDPSALIEAEMNEEGGGDIVYNPAFLPTPDSSAARLHELSEPTYGVTVQGRSSELLLQMMETRIVVVDPVAGFEEEEPEVFAEFDYAIVRNWQYDRLAEVLSIEIGDAGSLGGDAIGVIHRFGTTDGEDIVHELEDRKGVPESPAAVPLPQHYIDHIPRLGGGGAGAGSEVGILKEPTGGAEGSVDFDDSEQMMSPVSRVSFDDLGSEGQLSVPSTMDDIDDQIDDGGDCEPDAAVPVRRASKGPAPHTLGAPEMVQQLQAAAALALAEPGLGEGVNGMDDMDTLTSLRVPSVTPSEGVPEAAIRATAVGGQDEATLMPNGAESSVHQEMVRVVVRMMDRVEATRKTLQAQMG